jgi:hypothetical protein
MIKFTSEVSNTDINFLDLHIYFHYGNLEINTYFKSISKFAYIPPHSTHPSSMLKGMIIGELTRYYRTNTKENTFLLTLDLFKNRLLNRGYYSSYIDNIFTTFITKLGLKYIYKYNPHMNLLCLDINEIIHKRPRLLGIVNLPTLYDGDIISHYIHTFIKQNCDILPLHNSILRPTFIMPPSIGRLLLKSSLSKEQIQYIILQTK